MRRVMTVGFAPSALFVCCLVSLVRSHSFDRAARWGEVMPRSPGDALEVGLAVCAGSGVLCLLLNPFQVGAVRVLEGYWDRWWVGARVAGVLVRYQRWRWRAAVRRARGDREERVRAAAIRWLSGMPAQEVLLPTALGNALRAGEFSAGERYGLTTLASWPRIFPQVSEPLARSLQSCRDMLDSSVNMCHSLLCSSLLLLAALWDEPETWWLPVAGLVGAALAYQGAVLSARSYTGLMHVVYDLHRFDLVRALHYPLPDKEHEWHLFQAVSDFLADRAVNLSYQHGPPGPGEASDSEA